MGCGSRGSEEQGQNQLNGEKKGCRLLFECVQKMRCARRKATCLNVLSFQKMVGMESREERKQFVDLWRCQRNE